MSKRVKGLKNGRQRDKPFKGPVASLQQEGYACQGRHDVPEMAQRLRLSFAY